MIPTDFSKLIGNEPIKKYLTRMVERQAIANSLLFAGPDGIGKNQFAQALAATIICQNDPHDLHKLKLEKGNHPDIFHYRPEGKLGVHTMQSLRHLSDEIHLPPYEAPKKIFIIQEADRMLSYSANALLKTFEEPPSYAVIILLSSNPSALLPTVLSRCRTVYFQALTKEEIEFFLKSKFQIDETRAKTIASLSHGSLAKALQLMGQEGQSNRDQLFHILAQRKYPTYKALTTVIAALTERIEEIKKQVELSAKEEMSTKMPSEHLSAQQKQTIEKELEGYVSMSQVQEAHSLLEMILSWYRDLHLLLVGGNKNHLINPDYHDQLEQILQQGHLISLEQVQKAVEEARVALQRSMSLQVTLESLFLKLNLL